MKANDILDLISKIIAQTPRSQIKMRECMVVKAYTIHQIWVL